MKNFLYFFFLPFISCQGTENDGSQTISDEIVNEADATDESETADTMIPMDFGLRKVPTADFPDLDYDGTCFDTWAWDDKNGENYLIRTLEEPEMQYPVEDGWEQFDQYMHVYHYVVDAEGASRLYRDLTDYVLGCEFDLILYHLDAVELTDLDADNIGEITFGYRSHCTSDVSPSTQKVLTFENGDKYILRGTSEAIGYGGEYEPGTEFDNAPDGFLKNAARFWEANRVEYALTENEF
jgi:hypothetical protein